MRISAREKRFIYAGAGLLAALLLFQLAVYPAYTRSGDLRRLIAQKEAELREVRALRQEIESLKAARTQLLERIPAGERSLPPLSRLDGWIERAGLKPNIRAIKPSPAAAGGGMTVDLTLEKAELPELTRFFYEIQSSPGGFRVARMSLKPRYTTPSQIDVSLQMIFYQG